MITIKGMHDSALRCVVSEDMPQSDIPGAFEEILSKGGQIFNGADIVLDFGARSLDEILVSSILTNFVWSSGVRVAAWITYDAASQDNLKRVGLPTSEPLPSSGPKKSGPRAALMLQRSLRSGQRVEHRGDVIIAGHVNDGAEVLSSGHVMILGRLKGLVHAGYEGDESATVIARSMEAMQVRIGGRIGSLERDAQWWGRKVIVRVDDGAVLIDFWPELKSAKSEEAV
ncbi:MAG: septum site-determining protein MinC [Synergistaceae bacterium]|nr:septum site-determining protein MinC [Synergistaceae bacterium]